MRFINIRDFLRNMKDEVEDLPVTVTKYGQPVFTVVPFDVEPYLEKKRKEALTRLGDEPIVDLGDPLPTTSSVKNPGVI